MSMFTDPHHERITRAIATTYEREVWKHRGTLYTMKQWDQLPQDCQQEFADVATAAIRDTTYNGRELPQWVKDVARRT